MGEWQRSAAATEGGCGGMEEEAGGWNRAGRESALRGGDARKDRGAAGDGWHHMVALTFAEERRGEAAELVDLGRDRGTAGRDPREGRRREESLEEQRVESLEELHDRRGSLVMAFGRGVMAR